MIAGTGQRKGYLSDQQYFSQISDVTLSASKCTQIDMLLKTTLLSALVAMALGSNAVAQNFDDIVDASLITGWRQADGSHMAAFA